MVPPLSMGIEVSSNTTDIKSVDVLNGDHQPRLLGRVVWAWNGKKLSAKP